MPLTFLLSPSFHTSHCNTCNSVRLCLSSRSLFLTPPCCASTSLCLIPFTPPSSIMNLSIFVFLLYFFTAYFLHLSLSFTILLLPFFFLLSVTAPSLSVLPLLLLSPRIPILLNPNPLFFFFFYTPSFSPSPLWTPTFFSFTVSSSLPSLPVLMTLLFLRFLSPLLTHSPCFSLCLFGLQTYLPPRRQAAVGEVWKPALGRLSDLPRRASCLTSKGNE